MKNDNRKNLDRYLSLKYPVQLVEQEQGGYFVFIPDLPGCMSQGETTEEALGAIEEARQLWLEEACASGLDVPEPSEQREFSGRFVVRMPGTLHRRLARAAKQEGVSLNQYVVSMLSAGYVLDAAAAPGRQVGFVARDKNRAGRNNRSVTGKDR